MQISLPKFDGNMTVRDYAKALYGMRPSISPVGEGTKTVGMYSFKISQNFAITSETDKFWKSSVDNLIKNIRNKFEQEGGGEFPGRLVVGLEVIDSKTENKQLKKFNGLSDKVNNMEEFELVLKHDLKRLRMQMKPVTIGSLWKASVYVDYISEKSFAPGFILLL